MRSCAEMREPIELTFGVVSRVGPGVGVLDRVDVLQGEGAVSWVLGFSLHWFQWV